MKALFLLSLALATAPLAAQTADRRSPSGKPVHPNIEIPLSSRPTMELRHSTAQVAAARVNKPMQPSLPEFSVVTRDGLTVSSQSLAQKSHWLLIYRQDNCVPCDRIMNVLADGAGAKAGAGKSYTVLSVGKNKIDFDKTRASFAGLDDALWVHDLTGSSTAALKLHSAPIVFGMQGSTIEWSSAGNLPDAPRLERQATAWVTPHLSAPVADTSSSINTGK